MSHPGRGILTIVSGFAGSGKGTVMKKLTEKYDDLALSVSATSRAPRPGEEEGVSYFFKTREQFEEMIRADELLEYAEYVGNYYGTPKDFVFRKMDEGYDVILEIEVQGALQVKEKYSDALLLFVTPPTAEALRQRLVGRGTETPEVIAQRLAISSKESAFIDKYEYLVINDELSRAVLEVHNIIQSEHYRTHRCGEKISDIKQQLVMFAKGED
jgi:guanylate kinase